MVMPQSEYCWGGDDKIKARFETLEVRKLGPYDLKYYEIRYILLEVLLLGDTFIEAFLKILQEILDDYDKDIDENDRLGPWVGAHTGSSFDKNDPYSDWLFYDSQPVTTCKKFDKECDDESSK